MEFASMGWSKSMGAREGFNPVKLSGLKAWFRYNVGITVTGPGVSQWDDSSGNGNHLLQATGANRPSKEVDGSILFDGTSHYLKTLPFTVPQPLTIYILAKHVTWTGGDRIFACNSTVPLILFQNGVTPDVYMNAGATSGLVRPVIGTYNVISSVYNGILSRLQLNNETTIATAPGANDLDVFTLGSTASASLLSNIQVKEILIYDSAHSVSIRAKVIAYLSALGGI